MRAPSVKAEVFFDMIDISFNRGTDFVCVIPAFISTKDAGICPKIFLGINIRHSTGNGRCAGVLTMTDPAVFSVFTFVPCGHGTNEFLSSNAFFKNAVLLPSFFSKREVSLGQQGIPSSLIKDSESANEERLLSGM